jgi:hypothetical protein
LEVGLDGDVGQDGFSITVREQGPAIRKSRVRLSVSVDGLATIRVPVPLFRDGVVVQLTPLARGSTPDFGIEVVALNDRVEALVMALKYMARSDALSTLNWASKVGYNSAIEVFAHKKKDLWAATVAALILVRGGNETAPLTWFRNLVDLAPNIADARIALAGALALSSVEQVDTTEQQIFEQLKSSEEIGAPNFVAAHQLALDLLDGLRTAAVDTQIRGASRELYARWARRSRKRLLEGPYAIWQHLNRGQLRRGRLPSKRYLQVAEGRLGPDGWYLERLDMS